MKLISMTEIVYRKMLIQDSTQSYSVEVGGLFTFFNLYNFYCIRHRMQRKKNATHHDG